jgi:heme A synthase
MEAKKIQIKTLFLCLAVVLAIELGMWVVTSKSDYHPMLILAGARLLQILLIVLIVVTLSHSYRPGYRDRPVILSFFSLLGGYLGR